MRLSALVFAGVVAGCVPLPRPFEHEQTSRLLRDQRALAPVSVAGPDEIPALAQAVVQRLLQADIAATTAAPGDGFLSLAGHILKQGGTAQVIWHLTDDHGQVLGDFPIDLGGAGPDMDRLAEATAARTVVALRGDETVIADHRPSPQIVIRTVQTPSGFDATLLSRAMATALRHRGLVVAGTPKAFLLDGHLMITPGKAGQDQISIDWTVMTPDGRSLGVVSQGSPVPHDQVLAAPGSLSRDIADAGAEGIVAVVTKVSEAPPQ
jgi:hypothetical protein